MVKRFSWYDVMILRTQHITYSESAVNFVGFIGNFRTMCAVTARPGAFILRACASAVCDASCSLALGDMEDLRFDFHLTSAQVDGAAAPAAAGWCVRCPKHRKKFCGGLYFSIATGDAYVKGVRSVFVRAVMPLRVTVLQAPLKNSRIRGE